MLLLTSGKPFRWCLFIGYWLSLASICQAQTSSPVLEQTIRVSPAATTLGKVLAQIRQQTSLTFSYSNDVVDLEQKVNLPDHPLTVKQALDALLVLNGLAYVVIDRQIIIRKNRSKPRSPQSAAYFTLSGYIKEKSSGERLAGVSVYAPALQQGISTNAYGFYSLSLPASPWLEVVVSSVGYQSRRQVINLDQDRILNLELAPSVQVLEEVRVNDRVSDRAQMSSITIPIQQIKQVPALLGEKDVLKVLQLMPGVQKGREGSAGLYVRGGGPDQNLILLDEAVVYNANHLFGFFSLFNGDALQRVELTKGGFPARFGGRLSSVVEMNLKEGSKEKWQGEAGIGLIASRLTLEGPLSKSKKGSFLLSGRRTYLDALASPLISAQSKGQTQAGYYFYDLNAKVNYELGPTNKLYLSGYFGRDRFYKRDSKKSSDLNLGWGNATSTLRWNHLFSQKLFANLSLIFSDYKFTISAKQKNSQGNDDFSLRYDSGIRDISLKYDLDFYPSPTHALRVGVQSTYHRFTPSASVVKSADLAALQRQINTIDVVESGLYAEDTWQPSPHWRLNAGLRLSSFQHSAVHFLRPEPRLSVAYSLRPDLSIKASYALMNQYVHLLSNTGIGLPTDLWVPTTDRVKPQQSQQVALGLTKDFTQGSFRKGLTLTLEGYYKTMNNIISYKEGASFLLLDNPSSSQVAPVRWEDNVAAGRGWSYGAEVLLQKKAGRFSGWAGYTLSWTQWQFADLNRGRPFYPRYDRRHDISLVGVYELTKRTTLSGTWVYGTGQALTVPVGRYNAYEPGSLYSYLPTSVPLQNLFQPQHPVEDYGSQKNEFRAAPYHRVDVGIQFHKRKKHHERTWELSLYNAYNRHNPFFYQLEEVSQDPQKPVRTGLFRYSLFPIVPSCSYSFKF